jgi:hypothetical protein
VTAAATQEWWVLMLGALAAAALTALVRPGASLPPGLDSAHRERAMALWKAKDELTRELGHVPHAAQSLLSLEARQVEQIAQQALRLIVRHQELEHFLSSTNEAGLRAERERLDRLAAQQSDAHAQERYREASRARAGQLSDATALKGHAARLDAELSAIQAKLEAVRTQVLTLRSAQAESSITESSKLVRDSLSGLSEEIGAISDSFSAVTHDSHAFSRAQQKERS